MLPEAMPAMKKRPQARKRTISGSVASSAPLSLTAGLAFAALWLEVAAISAATGTFPAGVFSGTVQAPSHVSPLGGQGDGIAAHRDGRHSVGRGPAACHEARFGVLGGDGIGIVAGHLRLRVGQGSAPDGQGEGDDGVNGIARFDLVQSLKASP